MSDNRFSFFAAEQESLNFLSIDSITNKIVHNENSIQLANFRGDINEYLLPVLEMNIHLSEVKNIKERQAYTILSLLGDFGGFNDAIFSVFGLIMSFYSERMFQRELL